ncbi:3437_t:CDS:2, partial [Paraglomus occultum]
MPRRQGGIRFASKVSLTYPRSARRSGRTLVEDGGPVYVSRTIPTDWKGDYVVNLAADDEDDSIRYTLRKGSTRSSRKTVVKDGDYMVSDAWPLYILVIAKSTQIGLHGCVHDQ